MYPSAARICGGFFNRVDMHPICRITFPVRFSMKLEILLLIVVHLCSRRIRCFFGVLLLAVLIVVLVCSGTFSGLYCLGPWTERRSLGESENGSNEHTSLLDRDGSPALS